MGTINDFIKAIQKEFGNVEYKATSKDGLVFKTRGWKDAKVVANERQLANANGEVEGT
jgi:hypothetical protein